MNILSARFNVDSDIADDTVGVIATSGGKEVTFYVQLSECKHRPSLGCWITTDESDGDIDADDYPSFDLGLIIEAAEEFASKSQTDSYDDVQIDFHCYINSQSVKMRIDKASEQVELLIVNNGHIGDYDEHALKTGVIFDNASEAKDHADTFRTDEYQDASGLSAFLISLKGAM